MENEIRAVREALKKAQRVAALTGAGISAESGVPTFRGADGLWRNYNVMELAVKPSGIITLLTDFGLIDPYVGMMKGVILSINPAARLVDITHQMASGAVFHAARILKETYSYFPEGTVHLAVVDPGVGSARRLMALEAEGHFFVGPDNGIFWPVLESSGASRIVQIREEEYCLPHLTCTFHGREIFAPVAAHLSLGVGIEKLGPPILDPTYVRLPRPYEKGNILYGEVVRVDNFGNLITSIGRQELQGFLRSGEARVEIGAISVNRISRIYAEVEEGQPLALINSSDLLEIAVNMGRASDYAGMEPREILGTVVKVQREY